VAFCAAIRRNNALTVANWLRDPQAWRHTGGVPLDIDAEANTRSIEMKQRAILVASSLLSIILLTLHVTDDIVRGISRPEPSNTALLVLVAFLYGTLVLSDRRAGHVIMLLVGLFAAGMPVIHMRGAHYPEIARSSGGFFFVWTLWALGGVGGLTVVLSALGLWNLRRGTPT
jgi:hypothetical protein